VTVPHAWWRRARQQFGIDAPRMAVRTHLGWPSRVVLAVTLAGVVAGMWWWGFDFGQILGGFNRKEVETRIASLESENVQLRDESALLRQRASQAESELAMTKGALATLSKQALEQQNEASQLKEEVAFLQKLFADANKQPGVSIQRLSIEREAGDVWRYSLLVVRGGRFAHDFDGHLAVQVALAGAGPTPPSPAELSLPEDQPDQAAALRLRFKYYQRVEGSFRVPEGMAPRSMTVRAFESGHASPRATRNAQIS
jgi:uncharacterized protein DUF6776